MDDVERGRTTREARSRALAGDGASAPKLLRYLAAEAAVERTSAPPRAAGPRPYPTSHRVVRTHGGSARWVLAALEALIAVSAVGGAIGLIGDGAGIPQDWLERTPFDSWVIPGVLLLAIVAVPTSVAVVSELQRWNSAYRWSLAAGAAQVGWIIGQWAVLRRYFFLQPVVLCCGLAVMVLAWWVHTGRAERA